MVKKIVNSPITNQQSQIYEDQPRRNQHTGLQEVIVNDWHWAMISLIKGLRWLPLRKWQTINPEGISCL